MNKECSMIHRKMQKTDINCYQSCALHYQGNIFLPKLFYIDHTVWKTFLSMFLFFFLQLLIQQGQGQFPTMIHLTGRPLLLLFFAFEYFVYPLLSLFMLRKNIEMLDLLKMFQTILKNKSHHCLEVSKTPLQMLLSFKCRPRDLIRPF